LREEIAELRGRVRGLEHAQGECRELQLRCHKIQAESQRREVRISSMMQLAKDAIVSVDAADRIVLFNRGAEEIFGYEAGEVMGQPLTMLMPERFRARHSEQLRRFMDSNETSRYMGNRSEIYGLRKDETEFPAEASISWFTLGGETYFTAMVRDMTERKAMEDAFLQTQEELERNLNDLLDARDRYEEQGKDLVEACEVMAQTRDEAVYANHAKSEFLAHMSHEIRTPLNAILGFSEVIRDQPSAFVTPEKAREYAADIHTSGAHLLELINDILDLSKIEAGKLEVEDQDVQIASVVESSLRFVKERASQAGVSLVTAVARDLPTLRADARMMKQILINLLTNAVKFTGAGGKVTVTASKDGAGGIEIAVADTGVGIAPADLAKVLEAYGQAGENRPRDAEGTGLGLPLTKKMVELHGGALEIESELDLGTTVTARFPFERLHEAPARGAA
jgi:PAS domain S-box-containing protein